MTETKKGFRVEPGCPAAIASMTAFGLIVPVHILAYAEGLRDPTVAVLLVLFPVLSAILMILVILRFGQSALWFSIVAIFIGVLGFFFKLVLDPRGSSFLHHFFAVLLYLAILVISALTVLYVIKTKWIMAALFAIPFFKHIFVNDLPVLLGTAPPLPASMWLKEGSMLLFMLALSFFAMSLTDAEQ